jgi:uncharacterized protein DUF6391
MQTIIMQKSLEIIQPLLNVPYVRRTRRNHGLEHATIHLLSGRIQRLKVVGRSDNNGFWLYGDVPTEEIQICAQWALDRMRNGEHDLAIHPNCGTNLVTTVALGTVAVLIALFGSEKERFGKVQRIPMMALALMAAVLFGQPLGMRLQEHVTTLGDPGDLEIVEIKQTANGRGMAIHRVKTRSS